MPAVPGAPLSAAWRRPSPRWYCPSVVSSGSPASGTRFVVVGAAGVAGIIGFSARHHPLPIPANIAANQALRLAWQRRVDAAHADNEARRHDVRIVVRAGEPRTVQP